MATTNSLSNYAQAAVLNSLFGKTSSYGALASAPSLYVALLTAAPTNATTSATATEATYTGYTRVNLTGGSNWSAVSGTSPTVISNAAVLNFPACTGGTSTITHIAIFDVATVGGTGNMMIWAQLTASLAVSTGITPSYAIGQLQWTAD